MVQRCGSKNPLHGRKKFAILRQRQPRINTAPGKISSCVGSVASWEKRFIAQSHPTSKGE